MASLTAHWAKQVYTVSFDSDGGSAVTGQSVAYQDLASEPADPTRTGYDFQGWFLGGSAYDFSTPVTGALTLTAHWAKQVYTVSFDPKGGSAVASQSVAYQDRAGRPANPARTGYVFQGWYLGTAAYDFATPVMGSLTLTASWAVADTDGDGVNDLDELAGNHTSVRDRPAGGRHRPGRSDRRSGGQGHQDAGQGGDQEEDERIGLVRTNPCRADTDRDGLKDGREVHGSKARHTHKRYESNPPQEGLRPRPPVRQGRDQGRPTASTDTGAATRSTGTPTTAVCPTWARSTPAATRPTTRRDRSTRGPRSPGAW